MLNCWNAEIKNYRVYKIKMYEMINYEIMKHWNIKTKKLWIDEIMAESAWICHGLLKGEYLLHILESVLQVWKQAYMIR